MSLTEQEKAWLESRKNLCSKCIHRALGCILGKNEGKRKCYFFDADLGESDYKDAAEFEARVALWLAVNYFKWFERPCKFGNGVCPHLSCISEKKSACRPKWGLPWCKIKFARLAVEREMEKEQCEKK